MSDFHLFSAAVTARFNQLQADRLLFVNPEGLWEAYLAAFPAGTNPIFRERTEHDCATCRNFVKNLGHVVSVDDGKILTVWEVDVPEPYATVAKALDTFVRSRSIEGVYLSSQPKYGCAVTPEVLPSGQIINWNHFFGQLNRQHVATNAASRQGEARATYDVFKRGLDEITDEAINTVLGLIAENNLYRGEEHKETIEAFAVLKKDYDGSEAYAWEYSGERGARIRNTVIGTLLTDISEGVDINVAVGKFEAKVAPSAYKRTSAIITPRMIEQAVTKLRDLGLESAVHRRFARITDVSVNDVLFVDRDAKAKMKDSSITGVLMARARKGTPEDKNVVEVTGEDFFSRILPSARSIDLRLGNEHLGNFVSLTAPESDDVQPLFQWDNNFGWSYDGNVTDSIKQRVKRAGGNVDALFRASLSWFNYDDLDIHAVTPNGDHIYYGNRRDRSHRSDILDVDMNVSPTGPTSSRDAVENLAFMKIVDGTYKIEVHQFTKREAVDVGFVVEIEFGGVVQTFTYAQEVRPSQRVPVVEVTFKGGRLVSVKPGPGIVASASGQEKWGISTQEFVPVETIMLSPNHWGDQAKGNKHHIFILRGCRNPDPTRGFYTEFLRPEMVPHRKVFEVLASEMQCQPSDDQLSGVGFSSTRKDVVTLRVTSDDSTRTYKVQF